MVRTLHESESERNLHANVDARVTFALYVRIASRAYQFESRINRRRINEIPNATVVPLQCSVPDVAPHPADSLREKVECSSYHADVSSQRVLILLVPSTPGDILVLRTRSCPAVRFRSAVHKKEIIA